MAKALSNQEIEASLKKILWQNDHDDQQVASPGGGQGGKRRGKRNRHKKKSQGEDEEVKNFSEGKGSPHPQGNNSAQPRQGGKGKDSKSKPPDGASLTAQTQGKGHILAMHVIEASSGKVKRKSRNRNEGKSGKGEKCDVEQASQSDTRRDNHGKGASKKKQDRNKAQKGKRNQGNTEVKENPLAGDVAKDQPTNSEETYHPVRHLPLPPSLEPKPTGEELKELEKDFIFPLKKRSLKFPMAKYFCRLCEYHCDTVAICRKHMKDTRHLRLKVIRTTDIMLRNLPEPSPAHAAALSALVEKLYKDHALTEKEVQERYSVMDRLTKVVQNKIPGITFTVYGSTSSGFALKTSDLNLDLTCEDAPKQLCEIFMLLKNDPSGYFEKVQSDFSAKVPSVFFIAAPLGLQCQLGVNSTAACQTSRLLSLYSRIDPRVRKLGIAFRYWAKLCKVDCQDAGTLPSFVFGLMTVYFLQQQKQPILPALHEIPPINGLSTEMAKTKKEDAYFDDIDSLDKVWKCNNKQSVGTLWVQMLRFFSVQFDIAAFVISIRQQKLLSREKKKWASKKLAIEDPFAPKRNVARSVSHSHVFEYIYDRLRAAFRYFGIPQTRDGPLFQDVDSQKLENRLQQNLRRFSDSSQGSNEDATKQRRRTLSENHKDVLQRVKDSSDHRRTVSESASPKKKQVDKKKSVVLQETNDDSTIEVSGVEETSSDQTEVPLQSLAKSGLISCKECDEVRKANDKSELHADREIDLPAKQAQEFGEEMSQRLIKDAVNEVCKTCSNSSSTGMGSASHERSHLSSQSGTSDVDPSSVDTSVICKSIPENVCPCANGEIEYIDSKDLSQKIEAFAAEVVRSVVSSAFSELHDKTSSDKHLTNTNIQSEDHPNVISACADATCETQEELEEQTNCEADQDGDVSSVEEDLGSSDDEGDCDVDSSTRSSDASDLYDNNLASQVEEDELCFGFNENILSDAKGPAVMCSICQREGHLKQVCPEENLPPLPDLPPLTRNYKDILDRVLWQVPRDFEPRPQEVKMREGVLRELESFVQELYPDARLSLFGSSCNGFGFQRSDLDICMTLKQATAEGLNCVDIIENLAKKLRKHRGLYNVIPITTAKVPIVKFRHRQSSLEGDISLYNTLAQHNTRMLQMYSELDYRVKVLGYTMKVFAKLCDICDASRGSLSSYAYILMVLYYLQQRKPAVIPVLQELHKGKKPEIIVDGWNAWFHEDINSVHKVWREARQNQESLSELWIGLLRFYTEEFNFRDYVISIRQQKPLTRFEKLWNGKCIAIEDPFDLSHNLGAGVSRKMNMYILKALRNGRQMFGTPLNSPPHGYQTFQDYLFDPSLLTEGEPPNDRGCRICCKIGHFAKECPVVQARKERQAQEREKKRQERDHENDGSQRLRDSGNATRGVSRPQPVPQGRPQFQRTMSQGTPPNGSSPSVTDMAGQVFYNSTFSNVDPQVLGYSSCGSPNSGMQSGPTMVMAGGRNQVDIAPSDDFTWQQQEQFNTYARPPPHAHQVDLTAAESYTWQQQEQFSTYTRPHSNQPLATQVIYLPSFSPSQDGMTWQQHSQFMPSRTVSLPAQCHQESQTRRGQQFQLTNSPDRMSWQQQQQQQQQYPQQHWVAMSRSPQNRGNVGFMPQSSPHSASMRRDGNWPQSPRMQGRPLLGTPPQPQAHEYGNSRSPTASGRIPRNHGGPDKGGPPVQRLFSQ